MALPEPEPGLVIRYAYLWRREAAAGRETGAKDRPCVVVLAVRRDDERTTVVVAPITHAPPGAQGAALEIPAATKARLGLDGERSWIVTDDLNVFQWPGSDLRPINPRKPREGFAYGFLPRSLTQKLLAAVREHVRRGKAAPVQRS